MSKKQSKYGVKSQIRELLFRCYVDGNLDKESIISRLEISERQFYRLQKQFIERGELSHGLCNRRSNKGIDLKIKSQVIELYKTRYNGFNYEHASELMNEREQIEVSPSTLRNWLLELNITQSKRRKAKKYIRRTPRSGFNEMLQLDGTFYDFLGNGSLQCLMHLVDDATKTSLAYIYDAECTDSALDILYKWCCKYGIPKTIYSDRHSTYKVNGRQHLTVEEELEGKSFRLTEFGNVCKKLNIKQIFAYSPQAKGRVERKHQMYEDRFVKELRLRGITGKDEANSFLLRENGFCDKLNIKFTIDAREARTVTVFINATELAQYFTVDGIRTVRNDYTISYKGQVLQLSKSAEVNARHKVCVKLYLDGSLKVHAGNQIIDYKIVENYVKTEIKKEAKFGTSPMINKSVNNNSPWRNFIEKERKSSRRARASNLDWVARAYG